MVTGHSAQSQHNNDSKPQSQPVFEDKAVRAILENLQAGVVIIEEETHIIVEVNRKARELIGCEKGEIVGRMCHDFICPAQHGKCPVTDLGQTIDNSERILITWKGEKKPILKTVTKITIAGKPYIIDSFVDISTQSDIMNELKESEQRYRELIENANDLIQIVGPDGKILYVNKAWLNTLEYSEEEVKGMSITDVLREDQIAPTMKLLQGVTKGEKVNDFETVFITKSRKEVSVNGSGNGIFKDGEFIKAIGIFRDITERKKAEIELRDSEDRFRAIFESSKDGIMVSNLNGEFLFSNQAMSEMLGYTAEELKALKVADIHPQKDLPMVMDVFGKVVLEEIKTAHELPMQRKDGSVFFVDIRGNAITLGGQPCLVGVFRDITERKKASEQLRNSEHFLRTLIDSMDEEVMVIGTDYIIRDANRAISNKSSIVKEEIVGRHCYEISHRRDSPCKPPLDPCPLMGVLETGESTKVVHTHYNSAREPRFIELSASPISDEHGEMTGIIEVSRDITERKKMEDAMTMNLRDLERYKKATVDRELKMVELKERMKILEQKSEVS